ncbi:MAG: transposase [Betaproteobacteria bacterium]|nr:transposase [Candidatus Dechloromonas phosphorivorans]
MSLDDYAHCPAVLRVREVEVDGRILITTLLDPKAVTPRELDALYALRWNIEVDWRTIKVTMAMDVLRCRSPEMIEKEIAVHLLAYNLVRWTMASAAWLGDVLPRCLSFTSAKRAFWHLMSNFDIAAVSVCPSCSPRCWRPSPT